MLRSGLDRCHVGDLGLSHDDVDDQTLHVELHDLNRDEVVVGDVDEILERKREQKVSSTPTHLPVISKEKKPPSGNFDRHINNSSSSSSS